MCFSLDNVSRLRLLNAGHQTVIGYFFLYISCFSLIGCKTVAEILCPKYVAPMSTSICSSALFTSQLTTIELLLSVWQWYIDYSFASSGFIETMNILICIEIHLVIWELQKGKIIINWSMFIDTPPMVMLYYIKLWRVSNPQSTK